MPVSVVWTGLAGLGCVLVILCISLCTGRPKKNGSNSPRCRTRLVRAIAAVRGALRQWCRPRPRRRHGQAPTAGTTGAPGTFGISAWLVLSEARKHPRCREERTTRDRRRGRRPGDASPYRRRPVAGEGPGSRYSWDPPPFLLGSLRLWRDHAGYPRISRGQAPAIMANAHSHLPASGNG